MAYFKTLPRHLYEVTKKSKKNVDGRFLGLVELGTSWLWRSSTGVPISP